jgi:hypothetical protein
MNGPEGCPPPIGPPPEEILKNCIKMVASGISLECVSNNFYVDKIREKINILV